MIKTRNIILKRIDLWSVLASVLVIIPLIIWYVSKKPFLGITLSSDDLIITLLSTMLIFLLIQILKITLIDNDVSEVCELAAQDIRIRYGKDCSITQVNQMLYEAIEATKEGKVKILEAHLEPDPPKNNEIIPIHQTIISNCKEKNIDLNWYMVVRQHEELDKKGRKKLNKQKWIDNLQINLANQSYSEDLKKNLYNIKSYVEDTPSFNIVIIPKINQVYIGLGEWLNNKTGGIWIENSLICSAFESYWDKLNK